MNNNIQFKVRGVDKLLTYEQLVAVGNVRAVRSVRVIDIRTQRNWETNLKTVLEKFR
jgi:hypothetical protein